MIPTFGEKIEGKKYEKRVGVYAVIFNEKTKEIVLVQAPNGAYFLPGGEIEQDETQEEALKRELVEELGFKIDKKTYFGQSDEYFYSRHRDTYFYNPGYFYGTNQFEKISNPLEDFNQIQWFPIEKGIEMLKRGSHKWAVEVYLNDLKKKLWKTKKTIDER